LKEIENEILLYGGTRIFHYTPVGNGKKYQSPFSLINPITRSDVSLGGGSNFAWMHAAGQEAPIFFNLDWL
jgi:hypothetical protein